MDIKKSDSLYIIKLLSIILLISSFMLIPISTNLIECKKFKNKELEINPQMSSDSNILVDKVFNFTKSKDYVNFINNIPFIKPYVYYISVKIVTPHSCHMDISLKDPEGDNYTIYDSRPLDSEGLLIQFGERWLYFGVALTGNYTIKFQAHITENLNIHIKVVNTEDKCLEEAMAPEYFKNKEFYQINKFKNGCEKQHNITLKSDYLYRFYFGRYSPIAYSWQKNTSIYFNITSSLDIEYKIYANFSLPNETLKSKYFNFTYFDFGTAVEGTYVFNISIYCEVLCVNIAYTIIEKGKISDMINPNDPVDPIPDNSTIPDNNTMSGVDVYIPKEWTVGIIVVTGIMVGVPIIIVINRKKKNATGI
ncbi:MAG: hypothetical protein ACFFCE_17410 [Promethearchaeota archaeon]